MPGCPGSRRTAWRRPSDGRRRSPAGTVHRLAGRLDDGQIVATAVAWISHGLVTLHFVGTRPEHRRRGIGAAMTRAALDLAGQRGITTAALTSTAIGEPVYRSLGFRPVGEFRLLTF